MNNIFKTNKKYITDSLPQLYESLTVWKKELIYKDLMKYLGKELCSARDIIDKKDDVNARAQVKVIKGIMSRYRNLEREVEQEEDRKRIVGNIQKINPFGMQ